MLLLLLTEINISISIQITIKTLAHYIGLTPKLDHRFYLIQINNATVFTHLLSTHNNNIIRHETQRDMHECLKVQMMGW